MTEPLPVLVQSESWAIIAKPPQLLVHRNWNAPRADAALQRVRNQFRRRVYAIHRLDRAASGCLLFALEQPWASKLQTSLNAPDAVKTYLAFVRGEFKHDGPVIVDNPMADENGVLKEARSTVRCIGRSAEPRCSLLVVTPETGRYHQVRRHVRDLFHPILGDNKHGDTKINRFWRENYGLGRLALHCVSMSIPHPDGGWIEAECPLFEDMYAVLSKMPWWDDAVAAFPLLGRAPLRLGAPLEESDDAVEGDAHDSAVARQTQRADAAAIE